MTIQAVDRPAHIDPSDVVDFDIYYPPGGEADLQRAWMTLQGNPDRPIVWTPRNGGHWIPTRLAAIEKVMIDYKHFSTRVIILPKEAGEKFPLLPSTLQPPAHQPFRALLNGSLSPRSVNSMEDEIRAIVVRLIEGFRTRGHCNFTEEFAEQLPIEVFFKMTNLPLADVPKTKYWTDQLVRPDGSISFEDAVGELLGYLEPFVEMRMQEPEADALSRIVSGTVNDRKLEKSEAMMLALQVLTGGLDTVVNLMGFIMLFLAESPEHRAELRRDPKLIPSALDEMFRRYPVVTNAREVVEDFEFEGVMLRRGEMIAVPTILGGLDDLRNERPLEVNFHRASSEHVTFGRGIHKCPGAYLAQAELRIMIEEWLERVPEFAVKENTAITFKGGVVGVVNSLPLIWPV